MAEWRFRRGKWALLNPAAWEEGTLSIDQVLGARMISTPPDGAAIAAFVNDGGGDGCWAGRAAPRGPGVTPRYVLARARRCASGDFLHGGILTTTGRLQSGAAVFCDAGTGPFRRWM